MLKFVCVSMLAAALAGCAGPDSRAAEASGQPRVETPESHGNEPADFWVHRADSSGCIDFLISDTVWVRDDQGNMQRQRYVSYVMVSRSMQGASGGGQWMKAGSSDRAGLDCFGTSLYAEPRAGMDWCSVVDDSDLVFSGIMPTRW